MPTFLKHGVGIYTTRHEYGDTDLIDTYIYSSICQYVSAADSCIDPSSDNEILFCRNWCESSVLSQFSNRSFTGTRSANVNRPSTVHYIL